MVETNEHPYRNVIEIPKEENNSSFIEALQKIPIEKWEERGELGILYKNI